MTLEEYADLHGISAFCAVKKNRAGGEAYSLFILTARGNAREILDAASTAVMFHAIERAIGGSKKFFGRVAILGEGGTPALKESAGDSFPRRGARGCRSRRARNVPACFRQHDGEFVPAVASGGIDGAECSSEALPMRTSARLAPSSVRYLSLTT